MSTGWHSPATPTRHSQNEYVSGELNRTIDDLNAEFNLGLEVPDHLLSPGLKKQLSPQGQRCDRIYRRMRAILFNKTDNLTGYLERFRKEVPSKLAHQSRNGYAGGGSCTPAISTGQQAVFQILLLDILSDAPAKRARRQPDYDHMHQNAIIDALPVRTRAAQKLSSLSTLGRNVGKQASVTTSFTSTSTSISRSTSNVSQVFSEESVQDSLSDGQTTVPFNFDDDEIQDWSSVGTAEFDALDESCSQSQTERNTDVGFDGRSSLSVTPNVHNRHTKKTGYSASDGSRAFKTATHPAPGKELHSTTKGPQRVNARLANIWPRPPSGFQNAPLPVIWEVTRAALHCGVALDECDLGYASQDGWNDQQKLRTRIGRHCQFQGKDLPPKSDGNAWKAAFDTYQDGNKAVTLSMQFAYNKDKNGPLYDVTLDPLSLKLGHRIGRRFGHDRFLEVSIPSPGTKDSPTGFQDENGLKDIVQWLNRENHLFLGRTWVPFFVRDIKKAGGEKAQADKKFLKKIHFFACDGTGFHPHLVRGGVPEGQDALTPSNRTTMELWQLLEWAIGIKQNSDQIVPKLFSRLSLSLSPTFATVVLQPDQIRLKADVKDGGSVMNDGIGCMSRHLARRIADELHLTDCPSAFQARLGSAKGMWIIDVNDDGFGDDDWIDVYPSQLKWKCDGQDPHHRTFEVKGWSQELRPAKLNQQLIPILMALAIDRKAMRNSLDKHLRNGLLVDLDAQQTATRHPTETRQWFRHAGETKAGQPTLDYTPYLAGLPNDDVDKAAFLLDSGFDLSLPILRDSFLKTCEGQRNALMSKMHIGIPCSTYAFMTTDFSESLEEGEVHLSFSTKFQVEGFSDTLLEDMDVLIARSPAHLPSDIQRVRVVSKPTLRKLKDVIVFPMKGKVPLADMLSGGDYDGDRAWVCWDQDIVRNFDSVPVPEHPNLFKLGYFKKLSTTFQHMMTDSTGARRRGKPNFDKACTAFMEESMRLSLQVSLLGQCTKYKERYGYYEDASMKKKPTIVLSVLLSNLVDQAKQGIIFSPHNFEKMKKDIGGQRSYDAPNYELDKARTSGFATRIMGQPHILDYLKLEVGHSTVQEASESLRLAVEKYGATTYDADLTKLYNHHDELAKTEPRLKSVLHKLTGEIKVVMSCWDVTMARSGKQSSAYRSNVRQLYNQWLAIEPPEDFRSCDLLRGLFSDWGNDMDYSPWALLKASATFKLCHRRQSKFLWMMAGKQLGFIKARMKISAENKTSVLVVADIWTVLRPDKKRVAALAQEREIDMDEGSVAAMYEVTDFDEYGVAIDDA